MIVRSATEGTGREAVVEPALGAVPRARLGEVLNAGVGVPVEMIAEALASKGELRLGEHLVRTGIVSEDLVAWAVAQQYGLPYIDLTKDAPQPDATAMVTADVAHAFQLIPMRKHANGTLDVVVGDPTDALVHRVLVSLPVRRVRLGMAPPSQLRPLIESIFPAHSVASPVAVADDRRVHRVLEEVLHQAVTDCATDIHLESVDDHVRVRFRVDGVLRESLLLLSDIARPLFGHIKQIATLDSNDVSHPQRGQFRCVVSNRQVDVRVATSATISGEHCVLHLRDRGLERLELRELGMTAGVCTLYYELAQSPSGMLVVSGPARSGKTTTMFATLDAFDHAELAMVTIEDDIDLVAPGINQFRVDVAGGDGFATWLESITHHDPDVILIGELPDVESARHAVRAAITGCLVVTSVPAIDAVDALWRLLDLGLEPRAIASSVIAVENQRLLRRVCAHCVMPYTPTPRELAFYTRRGGSASEAFVRGSGCDHCGLTGYHGRTGIFEVLPLTDAVRRELLAGADPARIREIALSEGMHTLTQHAVQLVASQITTIDEIRRAL